MGCGVLRPPSPPQKKKVNQTKAGLFGTTLAACPPARELLILRHQGCPRPGCAHQDISPSSPDNQSFSLSARSYHKAVRLSISFICFHLSSQATKSLSGALAAQPRPLPTRGCGGSMSGPQPSSTDPQRGIPKGPGVILGSGAPDAGPRGLRHRGAEMGSDTPGLRGLVRGGRFFFSSPETQGKAQGQVPTALPGSWFCLFRPHLGCSGTCSFECWRRQRWGHRSSTRPGQRARAECPAPWPSRCKLQGLGFGFGFQPARRRAGGTGWWQTSPRGLTYLLQGIRHAGFSKKRSLEYFNTIKKSFFFFFFFLQRLILGNR